MKRSQPTVEDITKYDEIIDVRSPSEFAEDHIPGAINCPVLDDEQRAFIGTMYKQVSAFEANKHGAVLIARAIAHHLETRFIDRPPNWRPLIYCWRGGNRSGAMTTIFRAVGWKAGQLEGGYKAWRNHVIEQLQQLPARLTFTVISGPTGSGKSRLLHALADAGEQVLDLEGLAAHKGSVLGRLPDITQPSQKSFETRICQILRQFTPLRPVYVEAESRKIGSLHLPEGLIEQIRQSSCIEIVPTLSARVDFLLEDYAHFLSNPALLKHRLGHLKNVVSHEQLAAWDSLMAEGNWRALVESLLTIHYDPLYRRSQAHSFTHYADAQRLSTDDLGAKGITSLVQQISQHR